MAVKIISGKAKVKTIQPVPAGGGVRKGNIGKKGPVRGSTAGKGGPGWAHLPNANSSPNASSKGRAHNPSQKPASGRGGPHWGHMPSRPGVEGSR